MHVLYCEKSQSSRKEHNKNNLITQDTKIYMVRLNKPTSIGRDSQSEILLSKDGVQR